MSALLEYKCPCCGGAIAFDSSLQKLKCPYCDTEFELETLKSYDEQLRSDEESEMVWDTASGGEWVDGEESGMLVYTCNSCGGEIICDDDTAASSCPYCGNLVVMTGNLSGALRPDVIIPFKHDKQAAKDAFKAYLKDKKLLPTLFSSDSHIEEIKGVYVPVWLFDANAEASMRFSATTGRVWSDSNYNYRETGHYSLRRAGRFAFRNIPVCGSTKLQSEMLESLEPYDIRDTVDFQTAYLAGFMADKYDISAEESIGRANERITESVEAMLRDSVEGEYSITGVTGRSIRFGDGRTRYALYPVWLLNTRWKGENYLFAMNGQTGKFVGDLPMDKKKYWGSFAAIAAAVAAVVYFFVWLSSRG